jgi:hypothetical protein
VKSRTLLSNIVALGELSDVEAEKTLRAAHPHGRGFYSAKDLTWVVTGVKFPSDKLGEAQSRIRTGVSTYWTALVAGYCNLVDGESHGDIAIMAKGKNQRFAVAVRDGLDLFLFLTICRSPSGDVYVNFPRDQ